jgi:hypothetical protein
MSSLSITRIAPKPSRFTAKSPIWITFKKSLLCQNRAVTRCNDPRLPSTNRRAMHGVADQPKGWKHK